MTFAIHNGALIHKEEVVMPIDSIELLYGYGVYETVKIRNKQLFYLDEHIERLFASARVIELVHPFSHSEIKAWIHTLVEQNNAVSTNIKILLIGGEDPNLFIFCTNPIYIEKKEYRNGVHAITFAYERFKPQAKSLNMLGSYLAYKKAKEHNAWDAILIDHNSNAIEGTRANLFFIKDKTLVTTPIDLVLNGVTRRSVIACAHMHGYSVEETLVSVEKIKDYDGAFFTNTSGKIVPIKSIDHFEFTEIPDTLARLRKAYDAYLAEYI